MIPMLGGSGSCLPPAPFVSVLIIHDAGGLASPASFPSTTINRGQGGADSTSNLPPFVPKRRLSFSPEFALATSQCGHRAARLESVMPMLTMDDGSLPPRDVLSTSCAFYCLESELYFTVVFWIPLLLAFFQGFTSPPPLEKLVLIS